MTTPLIILGILFAPVILAFVLSPAPRRRSNARAAGILSLALAFGFFGAGHFIGPEDMLAMLPPIVPARLPLIYLTGFAEIIVAISLLIPRARVVAGWVGVGMFVLFFPANVYSAINYVPVGGYAWGPVYLLLRVPLQILLVGWAYYFVLRGPTNSSIRAQP